MICPNCYHDNIPGLDSCARCWQDLTHLDQPLPLDRIEQQLFQQTVRMLTPVEAVSVQATDSARAAVARMVHRKVGAALVLDRGKVVGIFSERDAVQKLAGRPAAEFDQPVADFMTNDPVTVTLDEKLAHVLHKMDVGDLRHLPVLDGDRPVGMISVRDVLKHIGKFLDEE